MEINKIYNESCSDTMSKMPNNFIDFVLTSPPYDNLRSYKGTIDSWVPDVWKAIIRELYRVLKDNRVMVWVVNDETKDFCESLTSFKQAIFAVDEVGFKLLDTMIYEKSGGPSTFPGIMRYAPWFEYMFVFLKGQKSEVFNPIKDKRTKYVGHINTGDTIRQKDGSLKKVRPYISGALSMRHNVWKYDVGKGKDTKDKIAIAHPGRFPEALAYDHIRTWSNKGDLVYDPLLGSGTTTKVARLLSRRFIGSEIVKEYFEIAKIRTKAAKTLWEKGSK